MIEQPPFWFRILYPSCVWRIKRPRTVFLTFDDGPHATITPWVLDTLDRYGVKATFFMVGDNVSRNPHLIDEVRRRGHKVGNHTMHHAQGMKMGLRRYIDNVMEADKLIGSKLVRPPHGLMRPRQYRYLRKRFKIVMFDVVTRDYSSKLDGEQVLANVRKYVRGGSIIVFHDSEKAEANMKYALPRAIEWLQSQGYQFDVIG